MTLETDSNNFAEQWWIRVRAGDKVIQRCRDCGNLQLHPRRRCNVCASAALELAEVSGMGTIYTFTEILRNAPSDFQDQLPYTLAIVRLAEGPHMLTRIINAAGDELQCDMPVEWILASIGGNSIPCFQPRFPS